ncbi:MAG: transketolase [Pseudomonadota bacterium]
MAFDSIHRDMSAAIAALSMDAVERAQSGHPGMPLGMADVATVLFTRHLKFDAAVPRWADRDRFILSAGHGSMLQYALLHLAGYEDMSAEELKQFRQLGAKTAGHPEYGHADGIETTTGPLGQGLGNAVGFALAEENLRARFGKEVVDHTTYVIAGDGCLMEGIAQEAITLAGHLKLSKLIVLWDDNGISIDGAVSLADSTNQLERFAASGWKTLSVDGHDMDAVDQALVEAKTSDRPVLIACKTTIGRGAGAKAGSASSHGAPLGDEALAAAKASLGWTAEPFTVPDHVLSAWREAGRRGAAERESWEQRCESSEHGAFFKAMEAGKETSSSALRDVDFALKGFAEKAVAEPKKVATRKASQDCLEVINAATSLTLGGSADLTGSNNTKTSALPILSADDYAGRYIHYGIREHAMGAVMNGLALHGGIIPYGGTFLVFSDYMRPSMRLAALMNIKVIYVLTHDSIGLGEDGPTHQPVEHLASLRAIPGLTVFRPGDQVETAEAWSIALSNPGPTVLALTRQGLSPFREDFTENKSDLGGYLVRRSDAYQATLIASGSEVEIALAAADELSAEGVKVNVASMPSLDRFLLQDADHMMDVLGDKPRLGIEAGISMGWSDVLGIGGVPNAFLGMHGFGASGPAKDLYEHFGITAKHAAAKVRTLIEGNS